MRRIAFRPYLLMLWAVGCMIASAAAVDWFEVAVLSVLGTPIIVLLSFLTPGRWRTNRWLFRNVVAIPLALLLMASIVYTSWPLRLHYVLARPAMNRLAAELKRGHKVKTPVQIGLWRIRRAEVDSGIACLWVDPVSGDRGGFVHTSPETGAGFNVGLGGLLSLDQDWQFFYED